MKLRIKKVVAATLAMSMCLPVTAMAEDATRGNAKPGEENTINTTFGVYSPTLHVSVPLKADVRVNSMADTSATDVNKFTVASNSLDVINASVDAEKGIGIPVNVTVSASINSTGADVETVYGTFAGDNQSTEKKIHLDLMEAGTAATLGGTAAADASNSALLNFQSVYVDGAANYTSPANTAPVTAYGSKITFPVAAPTSADFSDASQLTAQVGSFAITGAANTNADWKSDDVKVDVKYTVKAGQDLQIETPTGTAITATGSASAATTTISNIGAEATIDAVGIHFHDDGTVKDAYPDFLVEGWTVAYSTTTPRTATITIPANNATMAFLAGDTNGCKGQVQDLVVALSDGRIAVVPLTVN